MTREASHPRTLQDALASAARSNAAATFIDDDGRAVRATFASMNGDAMRFACVLREHGVTRGDAVLIAAPTSREFVVAFFGALYAGARPAPLPLPAGFGDLESFSRRVGAIGAHLRARHVITGAGLRDQALAGLSGVRFIDAALAASEALAPFDAAALHDASPDDVALLQCTSGSTGAPKAAVITQRALTANLAQIGAGIQVSSNDRVASWLPLNHDMGLIGCLLFSIYWSLDIVLLPPTRFLRRPVEWLRAISEHRATLSPAPNFAYGYATQRVRDEDLDGCDLSSWRVALCGAEPIFAPTMRAFEQRFAKHGFRAGALLPCYGLAEATLAVTFHDHGTPIEVDTTFGRPVVSCGRALPGTSVAIVDDDGANVAEGVVGNVHVKGPSLMSGYFEAPELTRAAKRDEWLVTGDLGYLQGGRLFITGRAKDIVIVRGRNYAPTEFEWPAEEVAGVRKGAVVAFGAMNDQRGAEELHLVCETDIADAQSRDALARAVASHVAAQTGVRPEVVHCVGRGTIPKTTSGKLQRARVRQTFGGKEIAP
jgi:acyl-CoA synthetase (AMP-forming)/AMP-acid ligase II